MPFAIRSCRTFFPKKELVDMIENYIRYYSNYRVQRNLGILATLDKGKHDKQQKNGLSTLPKTPPGCKKGGVFA